MSAHSELKNDGLAKRHNSWVKSPNMSRVADTNLPPAAAMPQESLNRRGFMKRVLAVGAAANLPLVPFRADPVPGKISGLGSGPNAVRNSNLRRVQAYNLRLQTALAEYQQPAAPHPSNGDEARYLNKLASFSKGLPHNELAEVDLDAYQLYLGALASGIPADFERIPMGCEDASRRFKFDNPQAGLAFDLEGADSHAMSLPPAPAFSSAEQAGEMVELYWMAVIRDVPFSEYATHPLTKAAAADLSRLSDFRGPKVDGQVTTGALFRGALRDGNGVAIPGCLDGPYISQFQCLPVPFGADYVEQRMRTAVAGLDFLTAYAEWLSVQNGCFPQSSQQFESERRFMLTGRDAAQWVHADVLHQAYFKALLSLLAPPSTDPHINGIGAPLNPGNPYFGSTNQRGFATFGGPHLATLMPEVSTRALHAVWFQKWFVHRRPRPEEYGGRLHNYLTGAAPEYPLGIPELLNSPALSQSYNQFGTYLLPQAFPEAAPLHPSYGSGHATVAGACVTILKAWFDETFVIPNPMQPMAGGTELTPYLGPPLTVGGELNKLAVNIALARDFAGIHWRSDQMESLKLGEAVAISILQDQRATYNEAFSGFTFTRFDGTKMTV